MVTITVTALDAGLFAFTITDGLEELERSVGRRVHPVIKLTQDTACDLERVTDVLYQVRVLFFLEDSRRIPWAIVAPDGRVLDCSARSS